MQFKPTQTNSSAGASGEQGFLLLETPRSLALVLASMLLLTIIAIGAVGFWAGKRSGPTVTNVGYSRARALSEGEGATYRAQPGPWGALRFQRSIVQVPEAYLGIRSWKSEPVRWFFKGWSPERLQTFLDHQKLSDSENAILLNSSRWRLTAEGIYIDPDLETLLSLSATARNEIYRELGKFEENVMQHQPFHWPIAHETTLFSGQSVSPESIELFRKLCYRRGRSLLFSDWQALLSALPDEAERTAVAQTLTGRYLMFASVEITPETDVESLIGYWGKGGFGKDIRPKLEAAAMVPGGVSLSLAYLLPPPVREKLNTFPFPDAGDQMNCHWTSFNFFEKNPVAPAGPAFWKQKLARDYVQVSDAPQYGDILLLQKPDGTWIHTCVFLADNVVYTKNGGSALAPWEMMTLPDLLDFYSWDLPENTQLRTDRYRRKS